MRISIDIDGVLADFVHTYLPLLERQVGRAFSPQDVTEFDFDKALGLSPNTSLRLMEQLFGDGFLRELYPVRGAVPGVLELRDTHDVHLVTTRPAEFLSDTRKWLNEIGLCGLRLTGASCRDKTDCCDGDLLIDDRWRTANTCASLLPNVVLLSWPWNERPDPLPANVHRAEDWPHICEIVDALANDRAGT